MRRSRPVGEEVVADQVSAEMSSRRSRLVDVEMSAEQVLAANQVSAEESSRRSCLVVEELCPEQVLAASQVLAKLSNRRSRLFDEEVGAGQRAKEYRSGTPGAEAGQCVKVSCPGAEAGQRAKVVEELGLYALG